MKPCCVEGCKKVGPVVRGMCNAHYLKVRKYGDPHYVARPPAPPGMKVCCSCREQLTLESFNRHAASGDGLYPACRGCVSRRKKAAYARDPESARARLRASYDRRRQTVSAGSKQEWADRDPVAARSQYRARHLKRKFGITVEQYESLLAAQQGSCASCGQPESDADHRTGIARLLAVDHDHATGAVRGLLCRRCNTALGLLGDRAEGVQRLLDYLK